MLSEIAATGVLPPARTDFVRRYRWPMLVVVVPTLIAALYLYGFAANQYVSEASFLVRAADPQPQIPSALGQIFGAGTQASAPQEAAGVVDFLTSHDAASQLQNDIDIVSMYRRAGADFVGRIKAKPKLEELTKYYSDHLKVSLEKDSGIIKLEARAFRPADSRLIAERLLEMSEQLVNRFSQRAEGDALALAQAEVSRTRAKLATLGDDPSSLATASVGVMSGLESQLATARAEFAAASGFLRPGSPRLEELRARVSALQGQAAGQRSRVTGPGGEAGYDRVITEREAAMREYQGALAAEQSARINRSKQHIYLVRVVEPRLAQKSLYPQRLLIVFTVFCCLLVAYGIGWLLIVGAREHAS